MPAIAIVGAGPGLGLSIAKTFGTQGFDVALIARNPEKLASRVEQLDAAGITAAAFPADVTDRDALVGALKAAAERFGDIDVLQYSPYPGLTPVHPDEVTVDNLRPQVEEILYGAVAATGAVLPTMLAKGAGTLLFTMGGGAIRPYPMLATANAAQAGLRNWALNLHNTLADRGVYTATIAINVLIGDTAPPGVPHLPPDRIAQTYWDLYTTRTDPERVITDRP